MLSICSYFNTFSTYFSKYKFCILFQAIYIYIYIYIYVSVFIGLGFIVLHYLFFSFLFYDIFERFACQGKGNSILDSQDTFKGKEKVKMFRGSVKLQ